MRSHLRAEARIVQIWWRPPRARQVLTKGTRSARKFQGQTLGSASGNHHHWKLLGPERRRAAVRHLQRVLGVSERFAFRVTGQHRATQRHTAVSATPEDPDAALRTWLRQYAKDHPRRGFRPRWEGWVPASVGRSSAASPASTSSPNWTAWPPSVAPTRPSCDATTDPN
jgi:hypothetical protein